MKGNRKQKVGEFSKRNDLSMAKILGKVSLLLLLLAIIMYAREVFNATPLFMGKTKVVVGYVVENKISPIGAGVTHEITYEYTVEGEKYLGNHFSNKAISGLQVGDSLKLKVSVRYPSKNFLHGFFENTINRRPVGIYRPVCNF